MRSFADVLKDEAAIRYVRRYGLSALVHAYSVELGRRMVIMFKSWVN